MRRLIVSFTIALALSGGVALAQYGASEPPTPSPTSAATPKPAVSPAAVVHVKDFAFKPETVTINAGEAVRFVQDDDTPHTVTAADKSFDSGNLDKGKTWTHTFAKSGTYAYVCAYHPSMKGTVVVK